VFFASTISGPANVDIVTPGFGYKAGDYDGDHRVNSWDFAVIQVLFNGSGGWKSGAMSR
jgi:hypothetical protein